MSNTELKPCPFCGGDAEIKIMGSDRTGMLIGCTECNCDFETFETCVDANIAWNARAPQDNWIPIEDTSKLNYGESYWVQAVWGDAVYESVYTNHGPNGSGRWFCKDTDQPDFRVIKYYQPLPEAKT